MSENNWFKHMLPSFLHASDSAHAEVSAEPCPETASSENSRKNWVAFGSSVRGASHAQKGLPNQDAIEWWPQDANGPPIILAVADGHGSDRCFRSDVGSKLAVETSVQVLREFVDGQTVPANPSVCKHAAEEVLPGILERRWNQAVAKHLHENPFLVDEFRTVEGKEGAAIRKKVEDRPHVAYGCTLLAVLIDKSFVLCVQIGDGDMFAVSEDGTLSRPIAEDDRHFGNETTSLSSENSRKDFQVHFQHIVGLPPVLLLLCTDGYTNAFPPPIENFLNVGREFVDALRDEGLETVSGYLSDLLTDASKRGSGDDVTVGMLFRTDGNPDLWPDWQAEESIREVAEADCLSLTTANTDKKNSPTVVDSSTRTELSDDKINTEEPSL